MPCCVKIFSMWGFGEFKVFLFSVDNSRKEECKPIERSRKGELLPVFLLCCGPPGGEAPSRCMVGEELRAKYGFSR
ncbi:uncharacterized protein LOC142579799 isoform X2 [Dermacentor variabilis]|uniref:uncharacterized protein LOC142579799 isoform X2 n=1 Tax=Dermacentor variabilis TaxID=34621 RepID=UPI003F5C7AFB